MVETTLRNLFSPAAWRRLWDRLGDLEAAMAVTEAEIHDRRLSRLEAEVAALRAGVGIPPEARFRPAPKGADGSDTHQSNA